MTSEVKEIFFFQSSGSPYANIRRLGISYSNPMAEFSSITNFWSVSPLPLQWTLLLSNSLSKSTTHIVRLCVNSVCQNYCDIAATVRQHMSINQANTDLESLMRHNNAPQWEGGGARWGLGKTWQTIAYCQTSSFLMRRSNAQHS